MTTSRKKLWITLSALALVVMVSAGVFWWQRIEIYKWMLTSDNSSIYWFSTERVYYLNEEQRKSFHPLAKKMLSTISNPNKRRAGAYLIILLERPSLVHGPPHATSFRMHGPYDVKNNQTLLIKAFDELGCKYNIIETGTQKQPKAHAPTP